MKFEWERGRENHDDSSGGGVIGAFFHWSDVGLSFTQLSINFFFFINITFLKGEGFYVVQPNFLFAKIWRDI